MAQGEVFAAVEFSKGPFSAQLSEPVPPDAEGAILDYVYGDGLEQPILVYQREADEQPALWNWYYGDDAYQLAARYPLEFVSSSRHWWRFAGPDHVILPMLVKTWNWYPDPGEEARITVVLVRRGSETLIVPFSEITGYAYGGANEVASLGQDRYVWNYVVPDSPPGTTLRGHFLDIGD